MGWVGLVVVTCLCCWPALGRERESKRERDCTTHSMLDFAAREGGRGGAVKSGADYADTGHALSDCSQLPSAGNAVAVLGLATVASMLLGRTSRRPTLVFST